MRKIWIVALLALFAACGDDDGNNGCPEPPNFNGTEEEEIQAYLSENNLNATRTNSGLYYVLENPGTGNQPTSSSNVRVAYRGYFTNGNVFDESASDGISFGLNQVIPGWTEGIPLFREGGNGILLLPSSLGYGSRGTTCIPGGSVLVFDVELIQVN
ncbi:MAG: FKBP-type peptidyl-prolyl cis-trans isomerase [Bacteroidota bacterium]